MLLKFNLIHCLLILMKYLIKENNFPYTSIYNHINTIIYHTRTYM